MLGLLLAVTAPLMADCVPMRWPFSDAGSLELLDKSPVNCLIAEPPPWTTEVKAAAQARGLRLLDALPATVLGPRSKMLTDGSAPIIGTSEALWPGIRIEKDGAIHAGPTASAWIDTNTGFLRYVRAQAPRSTALWVANRPPADLVLSAGRYVQAIADAAMSGARWVVALDPSFTRALAAREKPALAAWETINSALRFYETNRALWECPDMSRLAIVQDPSTGAMVSGGILDMIASKHIPVETVTPARLTSTELAQTKLLLNLDPASFNDAQKQRVREIARRGATVVNGPPGWKVELPTGEAFVFNADQIKQLDEVWREINGILGRRNFGVRLFNASTLLANLKTPDGGRSAALHLVNYSDYPLESITVQVEGAFSKARLLTPRGAVTLEIDKTEDGIDITIPKLESVGIVVLE